jgi:hypothetical protein
VSGKGHNGGNVLGGSGLQLALYGQPTDTEFNINIIRNVCPII